MALETHLAFEQMGIIDPAPRKVLSISHMTRQGGLFRYGIRCTCAAF